MTIDDLAAELRWEERESRRLLASLQALGRKSWRDYLPHR